MLFRSVQGLRLLGAHHPHRTVTAAGPPPALEGPFEVKRDKVEGIPRARIRLGRYAELTSPAVKDRIAKGGCSPLRLTEDGVVMPKPEAKFTSLVVEGKGAASTQADSYVFTASDDSDPASNGKVYALRLEEDRVCGQAVWVYPGDEVTVVADPAGSLRGGAATLEIAGETRTVPLEQVKSLWAGQYLLLWRPQTDQPVIGPGNSGTSVLWLRQRLAMARGQTLTEPASETFDAELAKQLRAFQEARGLRPDGIAGGQTLVLLSNLAPAPDTPSLGRPAGEP